MENRSSKDISEWQPKIYVKQRNNSCQARHLVFGVRRIPVGNQVNSRLLIYILHFVFFNFSSVFHSSQNVYKFTPAILTKYWDLVDRWFGFFLLHLLLSKYSTTDPTIMPKWHVLNFEWNLVSSARNYIWLVQVSAFLLFIWIGW